MSRKNALAIVREFIKNENLVRHLKRLLMPGKPPRLYCIHILSPVEPLL